MYFLIGILLLAYFMLKYLDGGFDPSSFAYGVCPRCSRKVKIQKKAFSYAVQADISSGERVDASCTSCDAPVKVGNGAY